MQWIAALGVLIAFGVMVAVVERGHTPLPNISSSARETPQVPPHQQANDAVQQEKHGNPLLGIATPGSLPTTRAGAAHHGSHELKSGEEEGTEFWPPLMGYRVKVTDSLLALSTIALAIFTWRLWGATDSLVRGSDDTSKRQLRAYVGLAFEAGDVQGELSRWVVGIKNYGTTPGHHVKNWCRAVIIDTGTAGEINFESGEYTPERSVIHPSERQVMIFEWGGHTPTPQEIAGINGGVLELHIFGRIDYVDVFGEPQFTTFRLHVAGIDSFNKRYVSASEDGNYAT